MNFGFLDGELYEAIGYVRKNERKRGGRSGKSSTTA